jgi:phosphoribosylformylglycinamidine cyclo-ligase
MGHRMEFYVPETVAGSIIDISRSFGIDAQIVGRVEPAATASLEIESEFGKFYYKK